MLDSLHGGEPNGGAMRSQTLDAGEWGGAARLRCNICVSCRTEHGCCLKPFVCLCWVPADLLTLLNFPAAVLCQMLSTQNAWRVTYPASRHTQLQLAIPVRLACIP